MLYDRAIDERNVFDTQDRFFRPRNADGQWVPNFDPVQDGHGFIEGTGWHYQWLAPSDMAWLVHAVGPDLFNQRLTEFFNYKSPGWYGQYYNPYNETDLEAPFEFNFSGRPWETQRVVRRVLNENYTATPDGIPGNDDCGEMSSWAVLSMMGIYTVDPASLAYELVGPVFPKVVVHLARSLSGQDLHHSRRRRGRQLTLYPERGSERASASRRTGSRSTTSLPVARCTSRSALHPTTHGALRRKMRRPR